MNLGFAIQLEPTLVAPPCPMQAAPNSHRALISVDHLSSPPSRLLLSFSLAPSNFFFPLLVGNILVQFFSSRHSFSSGSTLPDFI
ncbi:Uncharacterized protein HZ326_15700 [Fusarium oxysporum f. sp. albedinis]|nr:Uncharacterized protein HZ326_15700 [Fusarium oxysporum f. sp. albedinis]